MKNLYIISIALLGLLLASCGEDFLNPTPTSAVGANGYFTSDAQLETAVISMYDGIQGINSNSTNDNHAVQIEFYLTEMRSDNTRTKSSEGEAAQFESYTIESTNGIVTNYYQSFYDIISRANTVLANLDIASTGNTAKFEGEARFVRAYAYFNLVRLFGDIPLIDRVIAPLDTDIQFTRVVADEIYGLIISDLSTAISGLDDSYKTRASKSAAQALLAKVHLTRGNYTEARSLCEAVVGAGFSLESNFNDIFHSEGNNEVIFAVGYAADDSKDSQNFSAEWLNAVGRTSGVNYVTTEAKASLDANGGSRTASSYRQDELQPLQNQVVKYLPNSGNPTLAGNDWVVIRYADVLLMHVEAIMAGGVNTTDGAAISSFQAVRNRAGITGAVNDITKEMLIEERRVELAFENQRFFDLIRFGVATGTLTDFASNNGYAFSGTDLLLPIPQREINLSNGLLSQNPGY